MVSKGFANLFTLGKADLEETLKHYPDAKRILNAKVKDIFDDVQRDLYFIINVDDQARKMMKENEERTVKEGQERRRREEVNIKTLGCFEVNINFIIDTHITTAIVSNINNISNVIISQSQVLFERRSPTKEPALIETVLSALPAQVDLGW